MSNDRRAEDDRVRTLTEEVRELRNATENLGHRVEGLAQNVLDVNTVQRAQQETDRRSADAVIAAAEAIKLAQETKAQTVPRKEIEEQGRARDAAIDSYRESVVHKAYLVGVLALALMTAVVLGGANFASSYKTDVYTVCVQRNASNQAVRDYLDSQPRLPFNLRNAFKVVDCEKLR